jgi:prepilin-type processing-associated H-X9-DG protein
MVVTAILAVLAGVFFPAANRVKCKAQGSYCLNNFKQLHLVWLLYAGDQNDWLVPNWFWLTNMTCWTKNYMDFKPANSDNTNTSKLLESGLGPYLLSPSVYRCPGDKSSVTISGRSYPRVRSVSMNVWVSSYDQPSFDPQYQIFTKMSNFDALSPSQIFTFIDEREDSIGDSHFHVDVQERGSGARLWAIPGNYHSGAGTVSFADGHAESKRWRDIRTEPPLVEGCIWPQRMHSGYGLASPNNPDVMWLQEHSTYSIQGQAYGP